MTGKYINPADELPVPDSACHCTAEDSAPTTSLTRQQAMLQELDALRAEVARLQQDNAFLQQDNRLLLEKINAALDGTGICLWQGMIRTGELRVFNLQNFREGDMAPHFDEWRAKLHPEDSIRAQESYFGHLAGKVPFYEAEYRTINPQGQVTWLWDRGRIIEWDEQGRPLRIMGAHIDITQRKEYERRLAQQANTDALTGLLNRQGFCQAFDINAFRTPAALMFIDLDDFKVINDQLGHACGDRVLQRMADWLRSMVPASALCGRYGGDEFIVYLDEEVTPARMATLAQSLLARVVEYVPEPGSALRVGMSIGIALWHTPGMGFNHVLEVADRAMYHAKDRGKLAWHLLQI